MVGISYFDNRKTEGLKNLCWGSFKVKQPSLKLLEKAEVLAAVVEPELLSYSSDVACVTDVVVSKSFALPSKGT